MSNMKIKHKKPLLEQKAVQDEPNKPNKSPIQQVQGIQDQGSSSFDKAASTNTVQLVAEANNECSGNVSDANLSSSSKEILDSEVRSGQIDSQTSHACQTCKKTFPSESSLTKHMRSHETEEVTYACDVCRKHFPKLLLMQQHRRLHTDKISIECIETSGDNLSSSKDILDSDSVEDDQDFYTCQACQKTFNRQSSLTNHMRSHQSQEIRYACDICGKRFARLTTMEQHRGLHTAVSTNPAKIASQTSNGPAEKKTGYNPNPTSKDTLGSDQGYFEIVKEVPQRSVQIDDQGLYTCQTCPMKFAKRSSLTNHVRSHQSRETVFECDICGTRFSTFITMQQHRELHTVASTKSAEHPAPKTRNECAESSDDNLSWNSEDIYQCQICERSFDMKSSLSNHMRSHKERTYPCDICGKSFSQLTTMQHHRRLHTVASTKSAEHPAPKTRNECAESSDDNLSWNSEDTYQCQICERSFDMKSSLSNHMRSHKERTYPCDICGKSFSQLTTMQHHRSLHTGETPYLCKVCKKWFRTSAALSCHKRTHTGDNILKCEYCNKEFVYNFAYETHIRTHTGEKPFKCEVCNKRFSQTSAVNRHMLIHKAIAPFSCELCPRKFRQRSELKVHMRNHTGERPYPCTTCDRGFTQKSSLITHMKAHIKKERKRKLAAYKAGLKIKAKPEVVLVKEEREEMEDCGESEWVETTKQPARVKVETLEPRASLEEPQEDFLFEVPVINQDSFEVPLETLNPEKI